MRTIGKDGKVVRLYKASWDFLIPFDSDPNCAISKIQAQMSAKPTPTTFSASSQPQAAHACNFDEKKMQKMIKDTMEEVIAPFTG